MMWVPGSCANDGQSRNTHAPLFYWAFWLYVPRVPRVLTFLRSYQNKYIFIQKEGRERKNTAARKFVLRAEPRNPEQLGSVCVGWGQPNHGTNPEPKVGVRT